MNVFTEVYNKSIELLKAPGFDAGWRAIEAELKLLREDDGPDVGKAKVLDDLRDLLKKAG